MVRNITKVDFSRTQVEFKIKVKKKKVDGYKPGDPVFACFSFEDYTPDLMTEIEKNVYFVTRMIPPGKLKFCYLSNTTIFTSKSNQIGVLKHEKETVKLKLLFHLFRKRANTVTG
jgi:hypothetical protein